MSDVERYQRAAHAMQSGVALEMGLGSPSTEPKHLRVGVNTALSDMGALVGLLISKGLFTEAEYFKAIADQMDREVASYERRLTTALGKPVTLR